MHSSGSAATLDFLFSSKWAFPIQKIIFHQNCKWSSDFLPVCIARFLTAMRTKAETFCCRVLRVVQSGEDVVVGGDLSKQASYLVDYIRAICTMLRSASSHGSWTACENIARVYLENGVWSFRRFSVNECSSRIWTGKISWQRSVTLQIASQR